MGFSSGDPHKRSPCRLPVQRTFRFRFSLFNKGSFRGEDDAQGTDRQPDLTFPQHFWRINQKCEERTVRTFCTPHWTRCMCVCMCDLFTRVWMCGCMMYLHVHVCVCACVLENTSSLPGNPPLLRTNRESSDQALSFSVTMPMTCEGAHHYRCFLSSCFPEVFFCVSVLYVSVCLSVCPASSYARSFQSTFIALFFCIWRGQPMQLIDMK